MYFDDELSESRFARWLLHHSRLAGYDTTAAQTQMTILLLTAIALSDGLDATMTTRLAQALGVTPEQVTTAYVGEMRQPFRLRNLSSCVSPRSRPCVWTVAAGPNFARTVEHNTAVAVRGAARIDDRAFVHIDTFRSHACVTRFFGADPEAAHTCAIR
ncbi:hypothetical protein, partial [Streptomyces echinatus]|uniref:hypothetical protein n=1 Tax=Streptomyces echinatus TaxID=67293 RepID=UPI0031E92758